MIIPSHLAHLPPPAPAAQDLSDQLAALIAHDIHTAGGWISFARYMELALYAPGLGYYSAGSRKLGAGGDFVTAPELSPLFARCLARQLASLHSEGLRDVLEIGAGSGALAVELLLAMNALGCAPESYRILELSADLRERQRASIAERAPSMRDRVHWLDTLPDAFEGVIVANEVLDATPTHRVRVTSAGIEEIGVICDEGAPSPSIPLLRFKCSLVPGGEGSTTTARLSFSTMPRAATGGLLEYASRLDLPHSYETEINLTARALAASLARTLARGVMLFIDYGFPAREFYHPQRSQGTLMCHYRHHAHDDPFALVGLQDITTHVDFSAVATAAHDGGAALLGYTTQAQFLINCGITELLSTVPADDARTYAPLAAQAHTLLSPAEMGELFKVIALGKAIATPLLGFTRGDKSHAL